MRKIVKFSKIGEIAEDLKRQIEELKQEKDKLQVDVNKINDGYKGKYATIIIEKYVEKEKEIEMFIKNMERYQIILEWLSGSYRNSHNKAKKGLETENQMIEFEDMSILSSGTINLHPNNILNEDTGANNLGVGIGEEIK